jgi:repressor of nif and glnA expression
MDGDLDERTYDLLRLIRRHEPIGSIRLVELMQRHGYTIQGRTIRLALSDLDERGLTEKVPGKGRRLTEAGSAALETGHVTARRERIRARIATLTSRVTYDPLEDTGELVVAAAYLDEEAVGPALEALSRLESTPLGPCPVAVSEAEVTDPGDYRLALPSSLTLDGVLLSGGISTRLITGGIAEYDPDPDPSTVFSQSPTAAGGGIRRYIDVINGEGATVDIVTLLLEGGRTDTRAALEGDLARLIIDNREFPLTRYEEGRDFAVETRGSLGGVVDLRRPREDGPFPGDAPDWEFCSLTYSAVGEIGLGLLTERGIADEWTTLYGTLRRNKFEAAGVTAAEF